MILQNITKFLLVFLLLELNLYAQSASITWNLTADQAVSSISGNITGHSQFLQNLIAHNYTTNNAQRTSPDGSAGTWPAESNENPTRYLQYKVTSNNPYNFTVNSVSMYLWVNSGSSMRANVYYSTDSTFASKTQIGSTFTLSSTAPGSPNVNSSPGLTVSPGQSFYVRVYPWYTISTTGKHILSKIVTISGTQVSTTTTLSVSQSSLSGFTQTVGVPSTEQTYTLSGSGLTDTVQLTIPSGYEVSTDGGTSWSGVTVKIPQVGGSIPGQPLTISVRLNASSGGSYSGNIVHSSAGASSVDVSLSGFALSSEPTVQSTISFGTVTGSTIVVNFNGGNGNKRILVAKQGSSVTWAPTDGAAVSGVNSNFSAATDQGSGNKVIYDGTGTTVTMSGLNSGTTYYVAVYEYNVGSGNSQNYLTLNPGTGNQTTLVVPTISLTQSSLPFGGVTINTTSPEMSYSVSGLNLSPASGNISLTAPSGFEISTTSGDNFSSTINLPYTEGTLSSTTIYVVFKPTTLGSYSGDITHTGGGATQQNCAVTGTGVEASVPNLFQAEKGLFNNAYVRNTYTGYTGTGYVYLVSKAGSYVEMTFRRASAATDTITIYFSNGSGSARSLTLSLNEGTGTSVSFPKTTNWNTWSTLKQVVSMVSGINRFRISTTGTSTYPVIDKIVVGGQTATPVYKITAVKSGTGNINISPSDTYYDEGTEITLTASPSGQAIFSRWFTGTQNINQNPLIFNATSHKTFIGVMLDTSGNYKFRYENSPVGFAAVNALGYNGTTGGAGGEIAVATTATELYNLMLNRQDPDHSKNLPPLTVYFAGILSRSGPVGEMLDVKDCYDISIIGVGNDAIITGFGLNLYRAVNVIVRNIKFASCPDDGISVDASDNENLGHHIWIDHCTFTDTPPPGYPTNSPYDGALDITHGVAYCTVSWNHFEKHDKTCLLGHSDSQTSDTQMKITYHHNFFDSTIQRNPRVRFAKTHVYNNYYYKNVIYGVSSNMEADVLVENSYFTGVAIPTETSRDGSPPGDLVERNNIFVNCGVPGTRGTAFEPSAYYSYTLDAAADIPVLVSGQAGSGKYDISLGQGPAIIKEMNLTVAIEGLFNQVSNKVTPDTISVYLANSSSPYNMVDSAKAVTDSLGNLSVSFPNASENTQYYVVIKHRNSIETWSSVTKAFSTSAQSHNFTTSAGQAYGSNLKQIGSKYCIYSGDVNRDGQIDLTDLLAIDNDNQGFATGYVITDINGDGQVTLDDLLIADSNNQMFVSVIKP